MIALGSGSGSDGPTQAGTTCSDQQVGLNGPVKGCNYRSLLTAVILAIITLGVHLPTLRYDFVDYDDVRILKDHPELYGQPTLCADLKAIFVTSFPREEPLLLRDVSWALDSRIFGFGNAFGYHLGNVLLHSVVVGLLFTFLLVSTRRYGLALAVAAAYSILAIHTEAVAWIMGRKDILSALFMLLALCVQTRRLGAETTRAQWAWHTLVFTLSMCALLSKISALTLPIVLFLHGLMLPFLRRDVLPGSSFPGRRIICREIGFLVPNLVASGLIYLWYRGILGQVGILSRGYTAHGLAHIWNLLMIDPMALWVYIRQLFVPSQLAVLYTWPALQPTYSPWHIAIALATVAVVAGTGFWLFRNRKDLFFYYAAFFLLMVPYLNLMYIGIWVADRYVYFTALFPLVIAMVLTLDALQRFRFVARTVLLTVVGGIAALNVFEKLSYQAVWHDAESLWQYHVALPRPSVVAYENLAAYYYSVALSQQSKPEMDQAMRKMAVVTDAGLNQFWADKQQSPPQQIWYLMFLDSIVHEVQGDLESALATLLLSDHLRPRFQATNLNLARLYRKLAARVTDQSQQAAYALGARDRFAAYVAATFHGRPPPAEVNQELASIEAECTALAQLQGEPQATSGNRK
jgi:hypothetical protein